MASEFKINRPPIKLPTNFGGFNQNGELDRWKRGAQALQYPEQGSVFSSGEMNQQSLQNGLSTGANPGFGFNNGEMAKQSALDQQKGGTDWMGWAGKIGSGMQGLGQLAQGWAAIKGIGLAEDQLGENKRQYNQNYNQQMRAFEGDRTRANTRIGDQNAWKSAQGRTDLGKLIA